MKKGNVISGFMWRFAERCGAQGVSFIVSIILARLLNPEVYGTLALVNVLIVLLQVFVDSGMGNALIQKKDADNLDFSTVFYFNMVMCCVLYIVVFCTAPVIADFYDSPELSAVVRVLGFTLIISGVKNVQQAYVSKHMLFKKFFYATLGGTIGAAGIGIVMAYKGFGIWALIAQQLFNLTMDTIILCFSVKWRPQKMFSLERLKALFSYGWKLLVSSLLNELYNNMRQLLIGKIYSTADLAYYSRGKQFPDFIVHNINSSIDSVLFPTMSNVQDNREKVKEMTRISIKVSIYLMAPLMMGLAFVATNVVKLILTDKWLPCVPFLRIFCITMMFYPIHTSNLNAIKAMGRSDLFLKLEIIKKIFGMFILLSTVWFGVKAIAYGLLVSSIISQLVNSWPNKDLLSYGYLEQIKDIAPSILLAVVMGIGVGCITLFDMPVIYMLVIQIIFGAIIYVIGSFVLKIDTFFYLWNMGKKIFLKHTEKI